MNEIERLLNLVPFISTHQGISLDELSKEFGISKSELVSDLEVLFLCGLPGYTPLELMELTFEDGYVTIRNAEELQKPRNISSAEAALLLIGLTHLKDLSPEYEARISILINRLREKVKVPLDVAPQHHLAAMRGIQEALKLKRRLKFKYISRYKDESKLREVSPSEIVGENGKNYLYGFSHDSDGYRTYDIERMSGLELVDKEISLPQRENQSTHVKISITKRYRRYIELFRSEEFETFSLYWATRAVISAGGDVLAISPGELRHEVRRRAASALAHYDHLR